MEFILKRVKMIVTNIIHISEFPVQRLNILISGGTGNATFFFLSKEATAILHVFWVYAKRFPFSPNSPHSLSKPPRQISLNGLLTPYPLHTLTHIHKQTHIQNHLSHAHFPPPPSFSPWLSQRTRERECIDLAKWAAISQGKSAQCSCPWMGIAHFTWPPCLWETTGKPCWRGTEGGREGVQESGPWSGLGRRQIRAPHAAPACTYLCCWSSVSLSVFRTLIHTCTHSFFFSPHMWGTNNNFGVLVSQPSFLRQG